MYYIINNQFKQWMAVGDGSVEALRGRVDEGVKRGTIVVSDAVKIAGSRDRLLLI